MSVDSVSVGYNTVGELVKSLSSSTKKGPHASQAAVGLIKNTCHLLPIAFILEDPKGLKHYKQASPLEILRLTLTRIYLLLIGDMLEGFSVELRRQAYKTDLVVEEIVLRELFPSQ